MGFFDRLFHKDEIRRKETEEFRQKLRDSYASGKTLICSVCGKKPLFKGDDMAPYLKQIPDATQAELNTAMLQYGIMQDKLEKYTGRKGEATNKYPSQPWWGNLSGYPDNTAIAILIVYAGWGYDRAYKCDKCGNFFCNECRIEYNKCPKCHEYFNSDPI